MREVCEEAFKATMIKIIYESRKIKKEMSEEEFKKYLETAEFKNMQKKEFQK
jgi:hypothetical protein